MPTEPPGPRSLLVLALGAFVTFGVTHALLGTGWAALRDDFSRPLGSLGLLTAVSAIGYGLAAVVSGRVSQRHGTGGLLSLSYALTVAALAGVLLAPSWVPLVAAMTLLGAGLGLLDPALNAYVARRHGVSVMNLLHAAFGVGASLGPLLMIAASERLGHWRLAYALVLGVTALLLVGVWRSRARWGRAGPLPSEPGERRLPLRAAAGVLLGFLFAVGVETATAQWAFSILHEAGGLPPASAAHFVSLFWVGLTLGRLLGVVIGRRVSPAALLLASLAVSGAGLALLAFGPPALSPWGLPLSGAGQALVFPTLVVIVTARFVDRADVVVGFGCGAASAGSALLPWWLGRVAEDPGIALVAPWLFGFGVLLALSGALALRRAPGA